MDRRTIQMLEEVHALLSLMYDSNWLEVGHWTLFCNDEGPFNPYVGLYSRLPFLNRRDGRVYIYDNPGEDQLRLGREFRLLPKYFQDQVLQLLKELKPKYDRDKLTLAPPRSEDKSAVQKRNLLRNCAPFKILRVQRERTINGETKAVWHVHRCFPIIDDRYTPQQTPPPQPPADFEDSGQYDDSFIDDMPTDDDYQMNDELAEHGASEDVRQDDSVLRAEVWALFPATYPTSWQARLQMYCHDVTGGQSKQFSDLSIAQMEHIRAILLVDAKGQEVYADDWMVHRKEALVALSVEKIQQLSIEQLRDLYKDLNNQQKEFQNDES